MALNNFIGSVWAANLLRALEKNLVYGAAVNRDYEGEIRGVGDTVKITSVGDPTVGDYTKNTDISSPETLTDATRSLVINQAKFFNFQVDDIDRAQGAGAAMPEAMRRAGYKLRDAADQYIAAQLVAGATTNTVGSTGTPVAVDKTNAYETLLRASIKLDTQNAPQEGRFAIVPPWFAAVLADDDRFIGDTGSGPVLQNGRIGGRAAGFDILASNNVPVSTTKFSIIAGTSDATTFAASIPVDSVEAYRPEKRFADAVKGLYVYGAKVVRPEELVLITATDNSGLSA
jgi:hypothetical protein